MTVQESIEQGFEGLGPSGPDSDEMIDAADDLEVEQVRPGVDRAWKEVDVSETIWITREQAAEKLQVGTRTVDRLADDGKLPRYRLIGGRTVRFKLADVEALLALDSASPE